MAGGDENKKWVYARVEDGTHSALLSMAAELGVHFTKVIEEALDRFVIEYAKEMGDKSNTNVLVRALAIEDGQARLVMNQIKQLAYTYAEYPTDDNYDRLRIACESAHVDVELILEELNDAPHIAELTNAVGRLNRVEMWLVENMKPETMYSSRDLMDAADTHGIKEHALKKAKSKLGIKSKKEGDKWYWVMDKPTGEPKASDGVF